MNQTAFDQAMALHGQGKISEAMALYEQILSHEPEHYGAIHLLGLGLSQQGHYALAAKFIYSAIMLKDTIPEYYLNLGNAMVGAEDFVGAEQAYAKGLQLHANFPEIWFGLGNLYGRLGRSAEAVEAYKHAAALRPDFVEAMVNLGKLYLSLSRFDEAVEVVGRAAALRPEDALPRLILAQALEATDHPNEAAYLYASLAELAQCAPGVLFDAANRLAELGHHPQAVILYRKVLNLMPREMVLWNNLANSLRALDQLVEAKAAYTQALALAPDETLIQSNLGTVLKDLGDLPQAVKLLNQAVEGGGGAIALSNLGHAFYLQGEIDQAIHCFEDALKASPDDPDATFHLGVVQLLRGQWAQGWRHYESRWLCRNTQERRRHSYIPSWEGGDLRGKTLLLWSEQGMGDTLQFVRFADHLAAMGATVVVECQAPLMRLVQSMRSVSKVVAVGQPLPPVDLQVPMLSVPARLGLTLATLPQGEAYLSPNTAQVVMWSEWQKTRKPRVGIVWSGDSQRTSVECRLIDRRRSIELELLAPVLEQSDIQFVSLQIGPARGQLAAHNLKSTHPILDPADQIGDFADTAGLLAHLDLVVSVDTSVVHLAGAMGKPVWMLSRFDGCWRWLKNRTDSPWYPHLKIYAQSVAGQWQQPIEALAQDMAHWAKTL